MMWMLHSTLLCALDLSQVLSICTGPEILEIGCGTGLLSLSIAPYARSLLAVDAASGMIDALKMKLSDPATAAQNVQPLCIMLTDPEDASLPPAKEGEAQGPRRKFDLILSHLVLHHIPELEPLLKTMFGCLKPGGWISLTDFEDFGPEARKFHPEAKMVGVERHGIPRAWFEGLMKDAGFVDVSVETGWKMMKDVERFPGEWGQKKPEGDLAQLEFPFLLCCGRRP